MRLLSGSYVLGVVGLPVAEYRVQDVDAAACRGDDGLVVGFLDYGVH
jgi:hypothetical protein